MFERKFTVMSLEPGWRYYNGFGSFGTYESALRKAKAWAKDYPNRTFVVLKNMRLAKTTSTPVELVELKGS